jgi:hypothetical protein
MQLDPPVTQLVKSAVAAVRLLGLRKRAVRIRTVRKLAFGCDRTRHMNQRHVRLYFQHGRSYLFLQTEPIESSYGWLFSPLWWETYTFRPIRAVVSPWWWETYTFRPIRAVVSPWWWETYTFRPIRAVVFALVVGNVHISAHSCGRFRAHGGKRYASGHARGPLHPTRRSWVHRPESRRLVRSAVNVSKFTVFLRFQLAGGAAQCSGRMCRLAAVPWVISPLVQLMPDPPNCPTRQRRRYPADQLQASVSAADNLTALALSDTLF